MAARTVEAGYFGSVAMGDTTRVFDVWMKSVSYDFSKKEVAQAKTIPLLGIPKGVIIERICVVQTDSTNQAATVTFGLASDSTVAVGGNFALTATGDGLRACQAAGSAPLFVDVEDTLCLVMPSTVTTDGKLNAGKIEVFLRGYSAFAEGEMKNNGIDKEIYREVLQTTPNVSGGDYPLD